jgi:hypothetical protein
MHLATSLLADRYQHDLELNLHSLLIRTRLLPLPYSRLPLAARLPSVASAPSTFRISPALQPSSYLRLLTSDRLAHASHGANTHGHFLLLGELRMLLSEHSAIEDKQQELSNAQTVRRSKPQPRPTTSPTAPAQLTPCSTGRLLLRIPSPRHVRLSTLRPQKDPLPLWPGIRIPSAQRSRSLHPLRTSPEHNPQHRPCRPERLQHKGLWHRQ